MPLRLLATGIHLRYLPKQHIPPWLPMGSKRSPTQSVDQMYLIPTWQTKEFQHQKHYQFLPLKVFACPRSTRFYLIFFIIVNYYKTTAYEEPQVNNNHSTFYSKIFKLPPCSNANFKEGLVWVNLPPVKISEKPFFRIICKMIKKNNFISETRQQEKLKMHL